MKIKRDFIFPSTCIHLYQNLIKLQITVDPHYLDFGYLE